MIRNGVVFAVLVALGAAALWCSAVVAGLGRPQRGLSEAAAWRRLLRPLAPPALVFAAVLGWAVADPDDCEAVGVTVAIIAGVAALVVLRAVVRAVLAATLRRPILAGTAGILRPTICVAPEFSSLLDERALTALVAHERAHARHRDPARQLLAQVVTDLQWPLPGARRRLTAWRQALEIARDDEALESGADAADLAHAIVTGARLAKHMGTEAAVAQVMGSGEALSARVRRLLGGPASQAAADKPASPWLLVAGGLALSFFLGASAGDEPIEELLRFLP